MKPDNQPVAFSGPRHRRWWTGGLLLGLGLLSNLGSNFTGVTGVPASGQCAPGSEALTALLPSGAGLVGTAGAPMVSPVRVRLACKDSGTGRDILRQRVAVEWLIQGNEGQVNGNFSAVTATDDLGESQAHWALGATLGSQTLRINAGNHSLTVQATALAPVAGDNCVLGSAGGTQFGDRRELVGGETWTLAGSPYRGGHVVVTNGATLRIDPGVKVCVANVTVSGTGRLVAEGTALAPVLWSVADAALDRRAIAFDGVVSNTVQTSVLRHLQAQNLDLRGVTHPLVLEDSRFTVDARARTANGCFNVQWRSDDGPSTWRRAVFDGYGGPSSSCGAAVKLAPPASGSLALGASVFEAQVLNSLGDAVQVASAVSAPGTANVPPWLMQACTITGSGGHGVVFEGAGVAPGASLAGCNLVGNGGLGVNNLRAASYTVNAQGNWWGDPAGPLASAGDGVSAGVDASAPLAAPAPASAPQ